MTNPHPLPTPSDDPKEHEGGGDGAGLIPTLRRSWSTLRSEPAPYLAILFAFSIWAAATGLPGGTELAVLAGFGTSWLIILEAGSRRREKAPVDDRTASLVADVIAGVISIMAALVVSMLVFSKLPAFSEIVRLWLSTCAGLALWAAVGSFYWPTFAQPAFSEYETTWLARATTIGVAVGAVKALFDALRPPIPRTAVPACFARPDVFGDATDAVSRATFGFALFGGVFFGALWVGGRVGRSLGRRFWPARHLASQ